MADWFRIREAAPGVFILQEPGHVQCFLVCGRERAALIDTGMGFANIRAAAERLTPLPVEVFNTHWHFDHIGGNHRFESIGIAEREAALAAESLENGLLREIYIDACLAGGLSFPDGFDPDEYRIQGNRPDRYLWDRETIDLGGRTLTVVETPGHTTGSLSFLDSRTSALFCGDLLYHGTLYAHFTDSDLHAYQASLDRICQMDLSAIYTGHNSPEVPVSMAQKALDLIRQVVREETRPRIIMDWGAPVLHHGAGDLGVLTPVPGSPGINLTGTAFPGQ